MRTYYILLAEMSIKLMDLKVLTIGEVIEMTEEELIVAILRVSYIDVRGGV